MSLLTDFSLKSILLDIKIATPACFLGPFDWHVFSQPFTLKWYLFLRLRCVSYMQKKDGFFFHIQSVSLCLFIGELSLFTLKDINDQWWLSPITLVFIVDDVNLSFFPFLGFASMRPSIVCVFVAVVNFFGVGVFLLVFCVGLGLWLAIGE